MENMLVSFRKTSIVYLAVIIGMIGSLFGCAPIISGSMNAGLTEEDVKTKTADYFGVPEKELQITNIQKNTLDTSYKTRVNGKLYNCSVYYGEVDCKVPGG